MNPKALLLFLFLSPWLSSAVSAPSASSEAPSDILSHIVDSTEGRLAMFHADEEKVPFGSFQNLKSFIEGRGSKLLFAMNGGMYMEDRTPLGLYLENGVEQRKVNTRETAHGNFYLQPNGVFFISKSGVAEVCPTNDYPGNESIAYATQSGPMLLVDGRIHPGLTPGSTNLNVRNGVGILPDGRILFAMSRGMINFYDFASYFKEQGCFYALYLDGFVSRTYLPAQEQNYLGGNFGVIIAEVE